MFTLSAEVLSPPTKFWGAYTVSDKRPALKSGLATQDPQGSRDYALVWSQLACVKVKRLSGTIKCLFCFLTQMLQLKKICKVAYWNNRTIYAYQTSVLHGRLAYLQSTTSSVLGATTVNLIAPQWQPPLCSTKSDILTTWLTLRNVFIVYAECTTQLHQNKVLRRFLTSCSCWIVHNKGGFCHPIPKSMFPHILGNHIDLHPNSPLWSHPGNYVKIIHT